MIYKKKRTSFISQARTILENKFKTISLRLPGVFTLDISRDQPLITNMLKKIMNNETVYAYNLNSDFNNITDTHEIVKLIDIILKKKKLKLLYTIFLHPSQLRLLI